MEKWVQFYQPYCQSEHDTRKFVECVEAINDPNDHRHRAKLMMHQAQRLISLADDMQTIRPGKQSLQLLFTMICTEHIAKLHDNYKFEGQSRAFTRTFFNSHVVKGDRTTLRRGFVSKSLEPLEINKIVDGLYKVRCDVVHEGRY